MKLFLDTANVADIARGMKTGLIKGVTTNPSHVAATGEIFEDVVRRICELGPEHVSAEAMADSTDGLVAEAERVAALAPQIVVKIPMTRTGLVAVQQLKKRGVRTNVTMVFSPTQAFLAMSAGADYVSIVLSRLEKVGIESDRLVEDTMAIKNNYGFASEVLAASIKSQPTLLTCLRAGVDIATIPPILFDDLYLHPLTANGLSAFETDWRQVKTEIIR
jgi:transaldolase